MFFACIIVLMEADKSIQAKILSISDIVKIFFINSKDGIAKSYNAHFNQADEISRLREQMRDYEKLKLQSAALANDNLKLQNMLTNGGMLHNAPDIYPARIIAFTDLTKRDSVWIEADMSAFGKDDTALGRRIFGIIKDNVALGTAVIQNGRIEGFLNGNPQCNYDVYIGDGRAMGIVVGSSNHRLIIDYVPDYAVVKAGDKVFTSGLDGIFLEHIPVGEVESVKEKYGYLSVEVKPYASAESLSYVWLINRESTKPTNDENELDSTNE